MKAFRDRSRGSLDDWYHYYRPLIYGALSWSELLDPDGPTRRDFIRLNLAIDKQLEDEAPGILEEILKGINNLIKLWSK